MTGIDRAALRALAADVDPDDHQARMYDPLCACGALWPCQTIALAEAVPALLDENERLTRDVAAAQGGDYDAASRRTSELTVEVAHLTVERDALREAIDKVEAYCRSSIDYDHPCNAYEILRDVRAALRALADETTGAWRWWEAAHIARGRARGDE